MCEESARRIPRIASNCKQLVSYLGAMIPASLGPVWLPAGPPSPDAGTIGRVDVKEGIGRTWGWK